MAGLAEDMDLELETAMPGMRMRHVLTVVSAEGVGPAIAILQAVAEAGARLEALTLATFEDALSHRLRIAALSPGAARALSERLCTLEGVHRSTVEHHLERVA
jgi:glycine cleavage system regulatory protein